MNILYDYQILRQDFGGISKYFYELYIHMSAMENVKVTMPVRYANNYYFRDLLSYKKDLKLNSNVLKSIINSATTVNTMYKYKKDGNFFDIIHPTYYNPMYLNFVPNFNSKLVLDVHDMIPEQFTPENTRIIRHKRKMFNKANGIIAVSYNTKKDLLKWYPDLENKKIQVIYRGSNIVEHYKKLNIPMKYILFVGKRQGYKNFIVLLRVYSELIKTYSDLYLICVGGGNFSQYEQYQMKNLDVDGRVLQIQATDEELNYLYKNACCFIFPSLYEGFGLPILEAFSCDCPVVLSRCSCFPEIGRDAALYFDGTNEKELFHIITLLLDNDEQRQFLIRKGRERRKDFTWPKAVKQTLDFYNELIENT